MWSRSMIEHERRTDARPDFLTLRRELNPAQHDTLNELERFGWHLMFVRHPPMKPSMPVLFDEDRRTYAVLEADGTLNHHPDVEFRPH